MIDINNRVFICIDAEDEDDFTPETVFFFKQYGSLIQATYKGGKVKVGEMAGMVDHEGELHVILNHLKTDSDFDGGLCTFKLEKLYNKYKLHGILLVDPNEKKERELVLQELN